MFVTRRVLFLACFLLASVPLLAQGRTQIEVPRIERQTKVDDDGLQQWAEYQAPACPRCKGLKVVECPHCKGLERADKCIECNMTKQAPCPACAGTGAPPDPLEKVVCPMCYGEGCLPCDRCGNECSIPLPGSPNPTKCPCCKGEGGYECAVCRGERQVDVVKLRPSLGEADLKDLREAKDALQETLTLLNDLHATGKWRDDIKAYGKAIKPAERYFPALRKCKPAAEELMKRLSKLDSYTGDKESRARALDRVVLYNKVVLTMETQTIDLCIARQEHNEKVLAEKEKKDE